MIDHVSHEKRVFDIVDAEKAIVLVDSGSVSNIQRLTILKDSDGDVWFVVSTLTTDTVARCCFEPDVLLTAADNYMEAGI